MLKCLAEGKPTPSITWTRLSDNRTVTMPLINISRGDVMDYRCTADNGVGTPATRNVTIDVQCKCCSLIACTNERFIIVFEKSIDTRDICLNTYFALVKAIS